MRIGYKSFAKQLRDSFIEEMILREFSSPIQQAYLKKFDKIMYRNYEWFYYYREKLQDISIKDLAYFFLDSVIEMVDI